MADYRAIAATTSALQTLLTRAAPDAGFKNLAVPTYQSADLQKSLSGETPLTLSIWLYRAHVSDGLRNVPPTYVDGLLCRPAIPVDLFYLITAWAANATMQQQLLGWAIRTIEDTSTLPSTLLNDGAWGNVFAPSEAVELVWHSLTMQEEYDIWQIAQTNQQPSASYVARTVALASKLPVPVAPLAQTRELQFGVAVG